MSAVDPNNPPLQSGNAGWFFESGFYSLYAVPDSTLAVENLVNNVDINAPAGKSAAFFGANCAINSGSNIVIRNCTNNASIKRIYGYGDPSNCAFFASQGCFS